MSVIAFIEFVPTELSMVIALVLRDSTKMATNECFYQPLSTVLTSFL